LFFLRWEGQEKKRLAAKPFEAQGKPFVAQGKQPPLQAEFVWLATRGSEECSDDRSWGEVESKPAPFYGEGCGTQRSQDGARRDAAPPGVRLVEVVGYGFDDGAVGVVVFESPDESAAEVADIDVAHFEEDGGGIVVGPEGLRAGIVRPDGDAFEIEVARVAGEAADGEIGSDAGSLEIVGTGRNGERRGLLVEAVVGIGNARPAVAIGGNAEDEFAGRNAGAKVRVDGVVDEEIFAEGGILLVVE